MAGKVAIGFAAWIVGDGTTDPTTIDLTKDAVFFFSPDPLKNVSQTSSQTLIPLDLKPSPRFDIIANPPTGVVLGSYSLVNNYPTLGLSGGQFSSPSVSGYKVSVTPDLAYTNLNQVVGVLTFD